MELCRPRPPSCRPHPLEGKPGLRALVSRFRRDHAPGVRSESEYFRTLPSMDLAIHHVALAVDEHGRCYDHQFRIRCAARPRAKAILTASTTRLRTCTSFHELHTFLEALLLPVRGLGELYVYDASLRLGAHLGLAPTLVYLHAGTRLGARALGLGRGRTYLEMHELPLQLQGLSPDEVESFLCIYKAFL